MAIHSAAFCAFFFLISDFRFQVSGLTTLRYVDLRFAAIQIAPSNSPFDKLKEHLEGVLPVPGAPFPAVTPPRATNISHRWRWRYGVGSVLSCPFRAPYDNRLLINPRPCRWAIMSWACSPNPVPAAPFCKLNDHLREALPLGYNKLGLQPGNPVVRTPYPLPRSARIQL